MNPLIHSSYLDTSAPGGVSPAKVWTDRKMKYQKSMIIDAIAQNEFQLLYQPQLDATGGQVVAVEALLRWHSEKYGVISPLDFIPLVEKFGLISDIGDLVIKQSCEQLAAWKQQYSTSIRMAINVSYMQLHSPRIIETFAGCLERYNIQPGDLEVELTESSLIEDKIKVIDILNNLKAMGIRTAIDDFGTGYSSLSYLAHMPFDLLKIDRSFIAEIDINPASTMITESIISLAKKLDMQVLAEGVETEQQKNYLMNNACDYLQGNLFSEPVSAEVIPQITGMLMS